MSKSLKLSETMIDALRWMLGDRTPGRLFNARTFQALETRGLAQYQGEEPGGRASWYVPESRTVEAVAAIRTLYPTWITEEERAQVLQGIRAVGWEGRGLDQIVEEAPKAQEPAQAPKGVKVEFCACAGDQKLTPAGLCYHCLRYIDTSPKAGPEPAPVQIVTDFAQGWDVNTSAEQILEDMNQITKEMCRVIPPQPCFHCKGRICGITPGYLCALARDARDDQARDPFKILEYSKDAHPGYAMAPVMCRADITTMGKDGTPSVRRMELGTCPGPNCPACMRAVDFYKGQLVAELTEANGSPEHSLAMAERVINGEPLPPVHSRWAHSLVSMIHATMRGPATMVPAGDSTEPDPEPKRPDLDWTGDPADEDREPVPADREGFVY